MPVKSINLTGMINGWRTKMHHIVPDGSPIPDSTRVTYPIGKRVTVTITGMESDLKAFQDGLDAGLIPEVWLRDDGKFA